MEENALQDEPPPVRMVAGTLAHLARHMTTGCPRAAKLAALLLERIAGDAEADPHLRTHARELAGILERVRPGRRSRLLPYRKHGRTPGQQIGDEKRAKTPPFARQSPLAGALTQTGQPQRPAADAKRLAWLTRHNEELAAALERSRVEAAHTEAEKRRLEVELKTARAAEAVARAEAAELRQRLDAFETGEAFVAMGRRLMTLTAVIDKLRPAAERSHALQAALRKSQDEAAALKRERDTLAAERDALERLLLAGENGDDRCDGKCDGCENHAADRCVLCVGGRTALLTQYRALTERLGIRLIHHDGGQEESLLRLPDLINGADAVLCPTDCVSHAAYYKLKQHCKRAGKPCLLFKGAGVSSFAVALARLAEGQASIAGNELMQH